MAAPSASRFSAAALGSCLCLLLAVRCQGGSAPSAQADCAPTPPQSPINVDLYRVGKTGTESFLPKVSWKPAAGLQVSNTGTQLTVQSNQLGYVTLTGRNGFPKYYEVASVALKMPSEHLVAGRQFAAELQVVHKNQLSVLEVDDKDVLITSFLFEMGEESKLLKQLMPQPMPSVGDSAPIAKPVDLMWGLGPALEGDFYQYNGSYVAQTCGEKVQWAIFGQPLTLSTEQQQAFQLAVPSAKGATFVQPLGTRTIAKNTMEEGAPANFRFFVDRETAYNPEWTTPYKIFAPIVGTVCLCIAVMCSIFVREDAHRKQSSAGGLEACKPDRQQLASDV